MYDFTYLNAANKNTLFKHIKTELNSQGFKFDEVDDKRPWGGYFLIKEKFIKKFMSIYFQNYNAKNITHNQKISPKILVVLPNKKLSWQYHYRRSELWNIVKGPVGIVQSTTNEETPMKIYNNDDIIILKVEERHRLIGLDDIGIVAEIWQHIDINNPSDEEDIIRLHDDFSRR